MHVPMGLDFDAFLSSRSHPAPPRTRSVPAAEFNASPVGNACATLIAADDALCAVLLRKRALLAEALSAWRGASRRRRAWIGCGGHPCKQRGPRAGDRGDVEHEDGDVEHEDGAQGGVALLPAAVGARGTGDGHGHDGSVGLRQLDLARLARFCGRRRTARGARCHRRSALSPIEA